MVLREECIRDVFYALLTDYLIRNNFKVNNVSFSNAFPEFHTDTGSGRADLVLFEYLDSGEVSPFLLLEFKVTEVLQSFEGFGQLIKYCNSINPSYSGYIEFRKRSMSFDIVVMEGCDLTNIVYSKTAGTIDDKIVDDILRTLTSRKAVINKKYKEKYKLNDLIQNPKYSFEGLIKGEIVRGLMKDYVVSTECYTFISDSLSEASQKHYGYSDVVIYDMPSWQYLDVMHMCLLGREFNQPPFIVIEVKSRNDHNAYLRAYMYGISISSDYFATVIPYDRTRLMFEIFDTQRSRFIIPRSRFIIPFINDGNRFLLEVEILRDKLGSLPRKVRDCNNVPNGFYYVNRLAQLGVKIVPISSFNLIKLFRPPFSSNLILFIRGVYRCAKLSPDDPIVLASECMFPRLALVYEDGKKPIWCEFQNGVLAKCDVDVIAVYLACPCSTICVAKYISHQAPEL